MKPTRWCPAALALMAALGGFSPAAAQSGTSDSAQIRAARLAQNQAIVAQAWDSVASFWVPDVAVVTGLGLTLQGRDAYATGFVADRSVVYERVPSVIRVGSRWPLAFEEGTWTGRVARGVAAPLISGRYSAQWVKVKGRWLIRSELFTALDCSGNACEWPIAQVLR